ncbi:MAG: hypothetical protein Q8N43_00320, partial [Candidatus Azambacteria bacterium]|nr:hypothetical protein [Candidatus Azambacteria bacterium]
MDINIFKKRDSSKVENIEPMTREVSAHADLLAQAGLPKMLFYWAAVSRWALIIFAALAPVFFLPFTNLPVAVHKELLVFILILVAFFALLGRILIEGRLRYPGHLLMIALLTLVLVWGAATFFSFNYLTSLLGSFATPDSFFSVLLFALLMLSIVMTFDRRDIVISLLAFLASLSLLGLFELFQLLKIFILPFSFTKNSGFNPVGSVNDVGVLLAFGLVIASGLMSTPDMSKTLKRLLGLAVVIFVLNLIIIDFWAIWVGLALAMIFMISFLSAGLRSDPISDPPSSISETEESRRRRDGMVSEIIPGGSEIRSGSEFQGLQLAYFQKAWLPSIILLVSLFLLFIPSPLSKFVQTPIEVSPNFNATLNVGVANLKAGHYLLGSGPNTFGYIFNLYKPGGINQTIFWSTVFNSGASAMASWVGTIGILGVLALLFLIVSFIWTGIAGTAVRNSSRGIMNVASQAIFVAVSFLFIMWFLYVANFTVMAFTFWGMGLFLAASLFFIMESGGLSISEIKNSPISEIKKGGVFKEIRIFTSPPKTFLFSLLIVGLMVGVIVGIYFETNRYIAEIYLSKAFAASAKNDNDATINNISRAIQFWQYDERYFQSLSQAIFFQLNDLLAKKDLPQETLKAQFQNITTNAISAARQAQALNPQNSFNGVLLGNIYENLIPFISDASNFALSAYSGAVSLDPKNPSNYLALARVEITQADLAVNRSASTEEINGYLDKAVSNLNESLQLKNDYAPSRFLLVQVYDRQGKLADAIKRAEELVSLNVNDIGALFQLSFLYYKNDQFDQSKPVFE